MSFFGGSARVCPAPFEGGVQIQMLASIAHCPAALQVPASREQGQAVSDPGKTHCGALPLQKPAQTPSPAQAPRWPCGACRDGTGQQVPRWPETSQAWH